MNYLQTISVCAIAWSAFCLSNPALPAAEAEPITTSSSSGEYRTLWLQLEHGGVAFDSKVKDRFDVPLFLGLQDGTAVVAWFVHPALSGGRVVWLDSASLSLRGEKLSGNLAGRTNLHWSDKNVRDYQYTLDASISDGRQIAGKYSALYVDDAGEKIEFSGKLSGQIVTVEQAAADKLAAGKTWPHYYGDGSQFAGPACEAKLIDDLAQARPVWKSEAYIPTSYGSAPDSRYFDRAGRTGSGGGSSSPVVAGGRVFQFYYAPRGPVGLDKPYGKYETEEDLQAIAKQLFPKREIQQRSVVNHFRTQADEVLVCLDAASGQTLWKTTFPQRGNNYQTHKHRGHFPVPLVADGVVYQPGTTGRLYAIEAQMGKLLWEYPDAQPEAYVAKQGDIDCHAPSPVLVSGVISYAASGRVHGVDAKTGAKKWERPLWHRSSLLAWHSPEKKLLIASDRDHNTKQSFAVALDPVSGEILWKAEVPYLMDFGFPLLAGDLLLGYSLKLDDVKPGENDGQALIHAFQVTPTGLKPAWTTLPLAPIIDTIGMAVDKDHVYVSAAREAICLKLASGERVATVKNVGGARTQTAFVADGRLFIQPEGRHGSQSFLMLNANPQDFRVFPSSQADGGPNQQIGEKHPWRPPHTWTTAYANQPINYPLVDGRLFVRGLDAIYCYDLRAGR